MEIRKRGGIDSFSFRGLWDCVVRFVQGQKDICLVYNHHTGALKVKCYGYVQDRESKTVMLIMQAFERVHYDFTRSFKMNINCHDLCYVKRRKIYCYCKKKSADNIHLIPDYWFGRLERTWRKNYNQLVYIIVECSGEVHIYDTFWKGKSTLGNV